MSVKLTAAVIGKLPAPVKGNKIFYDSDCAGFGLRVTHAGARSFVLNYRTRSGRERRYTIGKPPAWTVADARKEAARLKAEIRVNGYDPLAELETERTAPTMGDLVERYIAEHLPTKRARSAAEDLAMLSNDVLPAMQHMKVAEVAFADITNIHRKMTASGRPVRANRARSLLSKLFSLAMVWGLRSDNPCRGTPRNSEHGRERYLSPEEIARLMKALAELDDKEAANLVMLALLSGARRGELLAARWDQFDLTVGTWTKPAAYTKQNKQHRVPINGAALELLRAMRERAPADQLLVFPGREGGARVDLKRPWKRITTAASLQGLRFHDLRHSYALVGAGLSLPVIGKLLGHTQAATTSRYAHLADDPLRAATELVGAAIVGRR